MAAASGKNSDNNIHKSRLDVVILDNEIIEVGGYGQ